MERMSKDERNEWGGMRRRKVEREKQSEGFTALVVPGD